MMNAMEKVAWAELLISLTTLVLVTVLYPWLGNAASGAFGLLGFLGGCYWFVRQRGSAVVVDERDQEIDRRAIHAGVTTAWMILFMALIVITLTADYRGLKSVPIALLTWLVWVQFAICYAIKGLVGVVNYRRQNRAA
jgi:hypothetical protein